MQGVIWFREDLRTYDQTALYHAAKQSPSGLAAIYILDINTWKNHDIAPCRVDFILRGLTTLSQELNSLNVPLILIETPKPIIDLQKNRAAVLKAFKNK